MIRRGKRRTFPYTTLTDWFFRWRNSVFSVRYELETESFHSVVDEEQRLLGCDTKLIGE